MAGPAIFRGAQYKLYEVLDALELAAFAHSIAFVSAH